MILASNRGPISFVPEQGNSDGSGFTTKRGAGGLAGALDPVARKLGDEVTWMAAATSEGDRAAVASGAVDLLHEEIGYRVDLLDIDAAVYSRYYDTVSNKMLWFALHDLYEEVGIPGFDGSEQTAWKDSYAPVNDLFTRAIARRADSSTVVLVQDYHLALVPQMLRHSVRLRAILHFTHSAFAGPTGMSLLPPGAEQEMIEGMLGADLVGFHVPAWCSGFLDCCEQAGAAVDRATGAVEYGDRRSWVRAYPIPIDAPSLRERAAEPQVELWKRRFEPENGTRLVVRVDRCEPSKNIVRGFHAYGRLFDERPDLYGKVRFVACIYPSRQSLPEYKTYERQVTAAAEAVNARYPGSVDLYLSDDFDRTLGALSVYDVLLVNPIRDGMNLVSKEGALLNDRNGVLVLSAGAGSFEELGEHSVPIDDPLDVAATAAALGAALDLANDRRRELATQLRGVVEERGPQDWISAQLRDLEEVGDGRAPVTPAPHV